MSRSMRAATSTARILRACASKRQNSLRRSKVALKLNSTLGFELKIPPARGLLAGPSLHEAAAKGRRKLHTPVSYVESARLDNWIVPPSTPEGTRRPRIFRGHAGRYGGGPTPSDAYTTRNPNILRLQRRSFCKLGLDLHPQFRFEAKTSEGLHGPIRHGTLRVPSVDATAGSPWMLDDLREPRPLLIPLLILPEAIPRPSRFPSRALLVPRPQQ